MITITKIEQQFKDNKPNGFKVNLSDGTWGYLVEKDSDKGLKDGDAVTYTAETPNGKQYKKLTIHKEGQTASQPQSTPTPAPKAPHTANIAQMKFDARMKVTNLGLTALLEGKFSKDTNEEDAARTFIQEWSTFTDTLVDEIFTGK